MDYQKATLDESDVLPNPFDQFGKWFGEVLASEITEANAMVLATADATGAPAARIVLLKGFDHDGFVFFTNYESRKGREIAQNNRVSLLFFWKELERQVRIDGRVEKLAEDASTAYFQSRPKASQIGAWASPQSRTIENRQILEQSFAGLTTQFAESEVLPRPEHWGGYLVRPEKIEFWQGRPSRLHDRILYTLIESNPAQWKIERLAP